MIKKDFAKNLLGGRKLRTPKSIVKPVQTLPVVKQGAKPKGLLYTQPEEM